MAIHRILKASLSFFLSHTINRFVLKFFGDCDVVFGGDFLEQFASHFNEISRKTAGIWPIIGISLK